MGRAPSVSIETIHQIKARIWDDADHAAIREEFGISYQMSVNIKSGRQYDYVPWPDGSIGGLPSTRVEQIAENKRYATRMGKNLGPAPTRMAPTIGTIRELDKIAKELGFTSSYLMQQHFLNKVISERMKKEVEEQRLRSEAYEESERIRLLPENVEARRLEMENMPEERDDICDPDEQNMYEWEDILARSQGNVVLVAENENDPALKLAIQICFKLFTPRQWGQDHVLRNIYSIKGKIEKFWDENPDRRPQGEQTAL